MPSRPSRARSITGVPFVEEKPHDGRPERCRFAINDIGGSDHYRGKGPAKGPGSLAGSVALGIGDHRLPFGGRPVGVGRPFEENTALRSAYVSV